MCAQQPQRVWVPTLFCRGCWSDSALEQAPWQRQVAGGSACHGFQGCKCYSLASWDNEVTLGAGTVGLQGKTGAVTGTQQCRLAL